MVLFIFNTSTREEEAGGNHLSELEAILIYRASSKAVTQRSPDSKNKQKPTM